MSGMETGGEGRRFPVTSRRILDKEAAYAVEFVKDWLRHKVV